MFVRVIYEIFWRELIWIVKIHPPPPKYFRNFQIEKLERLIVILGDKNLILNFLTNRWRKVFGTGWLATGQSASRQAVYRNKAQDAWARTALD